MTDAGGSVVLGLALAATAAFALSVTQSLMMARHGTDHAVHSFLVRAIRANHYRLFVRIPRLLNEAYVGALPLYVHWIFAHFRPGLIAIAERLLNPAMNAIHVALVAAIAWTATTTGDERHGATFVLLVTWLFALTPQFYHAFSARTMGLSARSIGLVLLTVFLFSSYATAWSSAWWAVLAVSAYLIWAFSTFGAQSLVILSVLLAVLAGRWQPLAGAGVGLLLFIAAHPRYSLGYLTNTTRFIRSYAKELAPIYLLHRRYSIWRDLVWDMWARIAREPAGGLRYAYENSLLVGTLLNPLLIVAVAASLANLLGGPSLLSFAADVALCGAAALVLTSFRATRFLGEPERYVEAVTPWITLAGAAVVYDWLGSPSLLALVGAFLVAAIVQLIAAGMLARHLTRKPVRLYEAEQAIRDSVFGPVRCASNNEQLTKLLMHNDWDFSYCIAVGHGYCGMTIAEAFTAFPYLRREALQRIVQTYRITVCALDRSQYEDLFDAPPPGLLDGQIIFESDRLRLWKFEWEDQNATQPEVAAA